MTQSIRKSTAFACANEVSGAIGFLPQGLATRVALLGAVLFSAAIVALSQGGYSYQAANAYVARKDWNGLLAYTRAWASANPNDAMAWYYMGQTYGQEFNRPADAAAAFRRAVALKPQWPEAWWALTITDRQVHRYSEALSAVNHAIQQAPDRMHYRNGLAAIYTDLNRWDDAVRTLNSEEQAMERLRVGAIEWYNLGLNFYNCRQLQSAQGAYSRAVKLNPSLAVAWTNLGATEQLLGNSQAALADYQRGSALGDRLASGDYADLQQELTAPVAARRSGFRPAIHGGDPATYIGPSRDASGVGYGGNVAAGSVRPPD